MTDAIKQIATQAQDDFDLGEYLSDEGATIEDKVKVYTNKKAGRELGGVEPTRVIDELTGIPRPDFRRWGIMGQIFDLSRTAQLEEENAEKIAELKVEAERLAEKLEETAIELEIRSLPPVIKKDAKRAARKALGINGKTPSNPDDPRWEEFGDEHDAQVLQRATVSITTLRDGTTRKGLSIENARKLKERLDETEFEKVEAKLVELLWRRQIGEQAVKSADF